MERFTPRLKLKELTAASLSYMHELHSLPEVDEFNTLGIPASQEETEALLATWTEEKNASPRNVYIFQVELCATGEFVGLIGLVKGKANYRIAETWYKLHPRHWGNGYASEALKSIIAFGFGDLDLHRIEAGCAVENIASIKVLESAGFTREGCKRQVLPIRGHWVDNYFYAILDGDFNLKKERLVTAI